MSDVNNKDNKEITKEISEKLLKSYNIILHGAPGTGKTHMARNVAARIVSNGAEDDYNKLDENQKKRIGFVQFHPSYDYTDFVEGLRPVMKADNSMGFELKNGIFKEFVRRAQGLDIVEQAQREIIDVLKNKSDILENVNLDLNQLRIIFDEMVKDNNGDATEDIIKKQIKNSNIVKGYKDKYVENKNKNYVFIIDEINRGEISKIFGELFFSIDPGYRGEKGAVSTQYSNMHDPEEKLYIPENVYIIGTMNDIDRSVDTFDFAMRRRFRFIKVKAEDTVDSILKPVLDDSKYKEAMNRMNNLNKAIAEPKISCLNEDYEIGPSYFIKLKDRDSDVLWKDYLKPLLEEYVKGFDNKDEIINDLYHAYSNGKQDNSDPASESNKTVSENPSFVSNASQDTPEISDGVFDSLSNMDDS